MRRAPYAPLALCCAVLLHVTAVSASRSLHQTAGPSAASLDTNYSRAGCDNFTLNIWQPQRPGYHITVPYGWMNDPIGMFQMPGGGKTHVFFQYNPLGLIWGPPFWGHVASDDLAHWTWLPPALLPDKSYDFNGCWSGSTTITTEGVPYLTYTAAGTNIPELGNKFQRQASAYPANMSDPWLRQWVKPDTNPFLAQLPPGGTNAQFRDPTEARHGVWKALTSPSNPFKLANDTYALAVGGQAHCLGNAAMYVAPNMSGPWRYVGNLYNQLAIEPEINGQCTSGGPAAAANYSGPSYGGPCDQFGAACRAWEVVDIFELEPGLFGVKWCDQSAYRPNFAQEWYTLSNAPWNYRALQPPSGNEPAGLYASSGGGNNNSALQSMSEALAQANNAFSQLETQTLGAQEVFGQQYSTYGVSDMNAIQNGTIQYGLETAYNFVNASDNSATEVLFQATLNGRKFYPQLTDYGSVYASMVYRTNDNRQVMFTWVYETAAGCSGQCSDQQLALTNMTGFKSVQSLPRQLTYDAETQTMRVFPVNETNLLRVGQAYAGSNVTVPQLPNTYMLVNETTIQNTTNTTARQMEVRLWFTIAPNPASVPMANTTDNATSVGSMNATNGSSNGTAGMGMGMGTSGLGGNGSSMNSANAAGEPFTVGARVYTGNNTYVDVFINGTAVSAPSNSTNGTNGGNSSNSGNGGNSGSGGNSAAAVRIASLFLWVDRSHAGGYTNTTYMEGGPVPTPVNGYWQLPNTKLELSMYIDHSMWEVYAHGGLARISSRVYPSDDTADWGLGVFGNAGAGGNIMVDGAVWNMENAFTAPNC